MIKKTTAALWVLYIIVEQKILRYRLDVLK